MATDLNDDFDKEQDLSSDFDQEQDLSASFEDEAPIPVKADDEAARQEDFWSQISSDLEPVQPDVVASEVASIPGELVKLPGMIAKQAPKEWETIKQDPAQFSEFAAKKLAQGASITGPQHGLSAAYEKYFVAPVWDKLLGKQSLKEAATTWVPERYQDRSVEDIAAQNIQHQKQQGAQLPLTSMASSLPGPIALQAAGIPLPLTLGAQKAGEVLEETGRPVRALAEGSKAALLTELLNQGLAKAGQGLKAAPAAAKNWVQEKAALETAKAFGGTPATLAKAGKERLIAAGQEAQPLVTGLSSKEKLREVLGDKIKSLGSKLESNVDDISSEISSQQPQLVKGIINDITTNAEKSILAPLAENLGQTAESPATFIINQKLRELHNLGRKTSVDVQGVVNEAIEPSFKNLNEFKKALGNEISSWEKAAHERVPDAATQQGLKNLYEQVKQGLEDLSGVASGNKGAQYKATKQSISRLKTLEKPAFEGTRQELQRDIVADLPGSLRLPVRLAQYGLAPVTIPLELAHRFAQTYGPQVSAQAFKTAEKGIGLAESAAAKAKKAASQAFKTSVSPKLLNKLKTVPQYFGPFAQALQKAAPRGSSALAATSYMLHQQYPEYRDLLSKLEDEDQ